MNNFMPIGDNVLLLPKQEGRLEDGVYVIGTDPGRMDAVVVAVGDRVSDDITVGSTVIAEITYGIQVTVDGIVYRLVDQDRILAVVEEI